jgi:hypothetical protein
MTPPNTDTMQAWLDEYEAWANGELSEISDEAMLAGSPKYQAVCRAILQDNGGDEDAARRDLRAAYERVMGTST